MCHYFVFMNGIVQNFSQWCTRDKNIDLVNLEIEFLDDKNEFSEFSGFCFNQNICLYREEF